VEGRSREAVSNGIDLLVMRGVATSVKIEVYI
jgi:hypothetical protein